MKEIYDEVVKLLNQLVRSSKDAMTICQQLTSNGGKRYHQESILFYTQKLAYIKKKAYDMFNVSIDKNKPDTFFIIDESISVPYTARGLKDHYAKWITFLKTSICTLSDLSKRIYSEVGLTDKAIEKVHRFLYKDQERFVREYRLYEESGWNPIEIHLTDHRKHTKEKKSMQEKGIK